MRELKILNKVKINNNTLIAVNDTCEDIKNGDYLIDNSGTRYLILSIGTGKPNITNILIKGNIKSKKLFIQTNRKNLTFSKYEYYGIPYGFFDLDTEEWNRTMKDKDRDLARMLINTGKPIPEDLEKRLLEYKEQEELTKQARDEYVKTGKITTVCPKCNEIPKIDIKGRMGSNINMYCTCGYLSLVWYQR